MALAVKDRMTGCARGVELKSKVRDYASCHGRAASRSGGDGGDGAEGVGDAYVRGEYADGGDDDPNDVGVSEDGRAQRCGLYCNGYHLPLCAVERALPQTIHRQKGEDEDGGGAVRTWE